MLVIRIDQIQQFIAADDAELESVIAGAVRVASGDRLEAYDEDRQVMINTGIERARSHGLTRAEDIAAFVAVMFEIGPRFDEQDEMRAALADAAAPPEMRFQQLFDRVSEEAWITAGTASGNLRAGKGEQLHELARRAADAARRTTLDRAVKQI